MQELQLGEAGQQQALQALKKIKVQQRGGAKTISFHVFSFICSSDSALNILVSALNKKVDAFGLEMLLVLVGELEVDFLEQPRLFGDGQHQL